MADPVVAPELYINRELALLEFNRRVLAQSQDEDTPLLCGECDDTTKTTLHSRLEERVRELLVDNTRLASANANMKVCP